MTGLQLIETAPADAPEQTADYCAFCSNTGWEEPVRGRGVLPCRCRVEIAREQRWAAAEVPERYQQASLVNFERGSLTVNLAHGKAGEYALRFLDHAKRGEGLLLVGNTGTGKTHLAVSVLREVVKLGCTARFVSVADLAKLVQDTFGKHEASELDVLKPVLNADLLVLDDLGRADPTPWQQRFAETLIAARYEASKPVIVTTNHFLQAENGAHLPELLVERVGLRVESRLLEMCKVVKLIGKDFRKELAARGQAG